MRHHGPLFASAISGCATVQPGGGLGASLKTGEIMACGRL